MRVAREHIAILVAASVRHVRRAHTVLTEVRRALPAGILKPPQQCILHLPAIAFALQVTRVQATTMDVRYAQRGTTKRRPATLSARNAQLGILRPVARRWEPRRRASAVSAQQGMVVRVLAAQVAAQHAQRVRTTRLQPATALVRHAIRKLVRAHARRRLQASVPQATVALMAA